MPAGPSAAPGASAPAPRVGRTVGSDMGRGHSSPSGVGPVPQTLTSCWVRRTQGEGAHSPSQGPGAQGPPAPERPALLPPLLRLGRVTTEGALSLRPSPAPFSPNPAATGTRACVGRKGKETSGKQTWTEFTWTGAGVSGSAALETPLALSAGPERASIAQSRGSPTLSALGGPPSCLRGGTGHQGVGRNGRPTSRG